MLTIINSIQQQQQPQEQMLRFPPSFKWNVGVDAQGFLDPSS
jgi:hypothetical protein